MRRFGSCILAIVFLIVALIPSLTHPTPAYAQAPPFAPPLPLPEDPLGQQPEQHAPEISVDVDVRDGHLTARVVDIWGPGRVPLVVRSYTNAQPRDPGPYENVSPLPPNSGPFRWQFNDILDIVGADVLEPDGNRSSFRYSHDRTSSDNLQLWQVYVKDVGTYATLELRYTCTEPIDRGSAPGLPALTPIAPAGLRISNNIQSVPSNCTWDGWHTVYLQKGRIRKFSSYLIAEERDSNGNVTTFVHTSFLDGVGTYLMRVTDPVGRQTNYSYEQAYQVCVRKGGIENPGVCVETKWAYRLRSVTDPYNRTSTYTYEGNTLKVLSVTNAAGFVTQHTYTPGGLLASITSPRGAGFTTTFEWTTGPDGTPRVARVTAPGGSATNYTYTHASTAPYRVIRTVVTNARGHATIYDMNSGDIVRVTNPLAHVAEYTYDARHNVTQVTDPRGNRTTYQYNDRNKVTQIVQAAGTLNLTTSLTWDTNDNLRSDLLSVTTPKGIRTDYTYNSAHNLTSVKRAVGTTDESLTQFTYTAWGGVASASDPRGNTTTYTYATTRLLLRIAPPAGGATSFTYNNAEDQVTVTNGSGRIWITAYDLRRLITSVTDPLNTVVRHEYDANGNRTRTYDAKNQATSFAYDTRDRLTSITDPLNGVTRYEYDAFGNLTRIVNARNHATTFTYDAANRLTQVTDARLQATTFGYDAAGNRTSMRDRKGATHSYA